MGQHPSQHRYYPNLNYPHGHPKNPKPHDGKETKAADSSAENSSAPEAKQGRAEIIVLAHQLYYLYTTIWFTQPKKGNEHEIPAVKNARKDGAGDFKCLLFVH